MLKPMTADDIFPPVAGLTPHERARLIRLLTEQPDADEAAIYGAVPPSLGRIQH